jgi:hypothetical protein
MMDRMLNTMMPRYQVFAWMGLLIVVVAFLFSLNVANANEIFFSADKATREAASTGSVLVTANVTRHALAAWVPALKFLGLGVLLGAITMALGYIVLILRDLSSNVTAHWPAMLNPGMPEKPRTAKIFPMLMMMGWIFLIISLVWALNMSGTASSCWAHSISSELNPAQPGSLLLTQLGTIHFSMPWIAFFRFLGMGFLFTAITVAVTVVIRTLQFQEQMLSGYADQIASLRS